LDLKDFSRDCIPQKILDGVLVLLLAEPSSSQRVSFLCLHREVNQMPAINQTGEDQRQYERLMTSLEASQGKLDLLIAVCDDRNLQAEIIQQYEQELREQGVQPFQVFLTLPDLKVRGFLVQRVHLS
jgi:hypothetical protein